MYTQRVYTVGTSLPPPRARRGTDSKSAGPGFESLCSCSLRNWNILDSWHTSKKRRQNNATWPPHVRGWPAVVAGVPVPKSKGNIRKRPNGTFQANWLEADGRRVYATFATQAEAKIAVNRALAQRDEVQSGTRRFIPSDKTFDDLAALWKDEKSQKRSLRDDLCRIETHLRPLLGGRRLGEIDRAMVTRVQRRALDRKAAVGTVRQILALLRGMLRLAVEYEWLDSAPVVKLPAEREHSYQYLKTEDEIRCFLTAAEKHRYPGLLELYATAIYTGLRAGELFGLRWTDVDLDRKLITVRRTYDQETTKTSKIRHVPILEPLHPRLKAWRERNPGKLVFPNEDGKLQTKDPRAIRDIFAGVLKEANIAHLQASDAEKMTFHDLRHTFASMWMQRGQDLFKLQHILGHTSIKLTMRYAHLGPNAFAGDRDAFDDYFPKSGPQAQTEGENRPGLSEADMDVPAKTRS